MMKQKPTIIYENTVAGSFVRRINRFTAEVLIAGETELVHVKNTGRLRERRFCRFPGLCPGQAERPAVRSAQLALFARFAAGGKSFAFRAAARTH